MINNTNNFRWREKVNDLETLLGPSVKYYPLINLKIDHYTCIESMTYIFLEYVPKEGKWKLLDQIGSISDSVKVGSQHDSMKVNNLKKHRPSGKDMAMYYYWPLIYPLRYTNCFWWIDRRNWYAEDSSQEIEQETEQAKDLLNLIKDTHCQLGERIVLK